MPESSKRQSNLKVKNSPPEKKILKLEHKIEKLEAVTTELEFENSDLRIDNKRLRALVNSLETKLSKLDQGSFQNLDEIRKRAAEEAVKLLAEETPELSEIPEDKLQDELLKRLKASSAKRKP